MKRRERLVQTLILLAVSAALLAGLVAILRAGVTSPYDLVSTRAGAAGIAPAGTPVAVEGQANGANLCIAHHGEIKVEKGTALCFADDTSHAMARGEGSGANALASPPNRHATLCELPQVRDDGSDARSDDTAT